MSDPTVQELYPEAFEAAEQNGWKLISEQGWMAAGPIFQRGKNYIWYARYDPNNPWNSSGQDEFGNDYRHSYPDAETAFIKENE